jgi:hypothetical protein
MEYRRYAEHCLRTAAALPNQEDRIIHREMSAEWFMLADQAGRKDLSPGAQSNGQAKSWPGPAKAWRKSRYRLAASRLSLGIQRAISRHTRFQWHLGSIAIDDGIVIRPIAEHPTVRWRDGRSRARYLPNAGLSSHDRSDPMRRVAPPSAKQFLPR